MTKFRKIITGFSVILLIAPVIVMLSMFSYSAFYYFREGALLDGTFLAKKIFTSPYMVLYYLYLVVFLIVSLFLTSTKIKNFGNFLMHSGVILIITSSMAASEKGGELINRWFGIDKIRAGEIIIYKGKTEDSVFLEEQKQIKTLPFSIKLTNLRIEFYQPGVLHIQNLDGKNWKMPAEPNAALYLDPNTGMVQVLNVFKNFKIKTEDGKTTAYDSNESGSNPAVRILYTSPHGAAVKKYIFAKFQNPVLPDDKIYIDYTLDVKDYHSDIEIIKDGKVVASGTIEVNRPFRFGGFHFYQKAYDTKTDRFTVLEAVSDTGLLPFYIGCIVLMIGVTWHFWFRHLIPKSKPAESIDAN